MKLICLLCKWQYWSGIYIWNKVLISAYSVCSCLVCWAHPHWNNHSYWTSLSKVSHFNILRDHTSRKSMSIFVFVSNCIKAILEQKGIKIIENKQMQSILLNPVKNYSNFGSKNITKTEKCLQFLRSHASGKLISLKMDFCIQLHPSHPWMELNEYNWK